MESQVKKPQGFTIVLGGEAGQGIQFIETLLVKVVKLSRRYFNQSPTGKK